MTCSTRFTAIELSFRYRVLYLNQNTQDVKNELFLISTGQSNVRNFGKCCLRQSDERTNRYKIRTGERLSSMSLLKIVGELVISKLDLCEGGSNSPTVFNSDIELGVSPFRGSYLIVRSSLFRRQHLPKIRTLFCLLDIKKHSFLTSCAF